MAGLEPPESSVRAIDWIASVGAIPALPPSFPPQSLKLKLWAQGAAWQVERNIRAAEERGRE